jgi:hypothetical protein
MREFTKWHPAEPPKPELVNLSQVSPLPPRFAVPDLLPICTLSLIGALPGSGRTTLACLLAAATPPPMYLDNPAEPSVLRYNQKLWMVN